MTSLLGIFFGLVLICGVFFGLGYSLGRHPSAESPTTSASVTQTADDAAAARAKPSAQQALQTADSGLPAADNSTPFTDAESTDTPAVTRPSAQLVSDSQPTMASAPRSQPARLKSAVANPALAAAQPAATRATPPPALTPATVVSTTPTMVQIAAVSRQDDADVLVSALKSHGFNVTVRNEAQDKLLHVQVGPFATRDQAKAMRQKLLDAGYNAILKP
jgi:DedD protein